MWKRLLSILLCLVTIPALLTSCSQEQAPELEADESGIDYNQFINANGFYAVTNSAYYICESGRLRVLESSLQAPVSILCAKADCTHTNPNECSAYLPDGSPAIYAWNGALYYDVWTDDGKLAIYQMDLDGQGRKLAGTLSVGSLSGSVSYLIDIACGHLLVTLYDDTPAGEVITLYLFEMEDLSGEPLVLFTNQEQIASGVERQEVLSRPFPVCLSEDWIFYGTEQGERESRQRSLYGYQISTETTTQLIEDGYYPSDDLSTSGNELHWYDTDGRLFTIDLSTAEVTANVEIPVDEQEYGSMDDHWLYITGGTSAETAEVVVYGLDGIEVQRLSCAEVGVPLSYAFSTSDRVFFRKSGFDAMDPVCYLEKTELSNGNAKLIPLSAE